VYVTCL